MEMSELGKQALHRFFSFQSNVQSEIRRMVCSINNFYNRVNKAETELTKVPVRPAETENRETEPVEAQTSL